MEKLECYKKQIEIIHDTIDTLKNSNNSLRYEEYSDYVPDSVIQALIHKVTKLVDSIVEELDDTGHCEPERNAILSDWFSSWAPVVKPVAFDFLDWSLMDSVDFKEIWEYENANRRLSPLLIKNLNDNLHLVVYRPNNTKYTYDVFKKEDFITTLLGIEQDIIQQQADDDCLSM